MKISLKHKIFLLVLFGLFGLFLSSSFIFYKNLENFAKHNAFKDAEQDINLINHKVEDIKEQLNLHINQLKDNKNLISSLDLVSNYQDKNNYEKNIFDNEKRNLLFALSNMIGKSTSWSAAVFDKDKDLVAIKEYKNNKYLMAYTSIENKKLNLYTYNKKHLKSFNHEKLDISDLEKFKIEDRKDEIAFKKTIRLKNAFDTIGYLRVTYILNSQNYPDFIKGIENNIILITKNITLNSGKLEIDFSTIDKKQINQIKNYNDYFFNLNELYNSHVHIISYIDKSIYNKYLNGMFTDLSISLILIILIFLFISSLFTSRFITRPLDKLLKGIGKLKNKEVLKIDINTGDEIETIAKEFNNISFQLKNSFKSLEDAKILLENVLNTVPMSIFIKDKDGNYMLVNKLFLNDAGLENDWEIIGKDDFSIWDKNDAEFYRKKDLEIIETKKEELNFEENQIRNGKEHTLLTSKMPLMNSKGETIGILGVYKDITDEKKTQAKLKEKEKYLLHQSRLAQMGEMISMIAHQWRQPLAAISSTTNTLILKSMTGRFESDYFNERLKNISDYSQHLSSTIDDFRNFFKKNKEKREILLNTIIDDSLRIIQTGMENKNIKILKQYDDINKINTYPNELRQVVLNLIKNAEDILIEKNMENKWIELKTYEENGRHILTIGDSGGGIDEKIINKIFEPYFSTKTNKDGTGLGLYMSKAIIEDHCKGNLTVQNGQYGAIFKIIL